MTTAPNSDHEYDVCLSFAGEQRAYVRRVAKALRDSGVRVFYDDYEQAAIWGKDLYEHLNYIYSRAARYCVLFASVDYADKVWTNHERRSAQERALRENMEYVLPVRFDDTEIPGLRSTVSYVDAREITASALAKLIKQKLGPRVRSNFVPPDPDVLYSELELTSQEDKDVARGVAHSFMSSLQRMTLDERRLVATIFSIGCPTQLPENIHADLDLIRRETGMSPQEIIDTMKGMSSLGFESEVRENSDHEDPQIVVTWDDRSARGLSDYAMENSTLVADAMLKIGMGDKCETCAHNCISALDFSSLSSKTYA